MKNVKKQKPRNKGFMFFDKKTNHFSTSGLTLIELLVVIVVIAVLASIVVIAINPGEKLAQMRDNERETHLNAILSAVKERVLMTRGEWACGAGEIPETFTTISSGEYDLYLCIYPVFLSEKFYDPTEGEYIDDITYDTKYQIKKDSETGIISLRAPEGETRTIYKGEEE